MKAAGGGTRGSRILELPASSADTGFGGRRESCVATQVITCSRSSVRRSLPGHHAPSPHAASPLEPQAPRVAELPGRRADGPASLVLTLKSPLPPKKAQGLGATYELRLVELPFRISVKEGEFVAARGEAESPDVLIRSDLGTIASVVFGGNRLGKRSAPATPPSTGAARRSRPCSGR